jgi:hypothetical protein
LLFAVLLRPKLVVTIFHQVYQPVQSSAIAVAQKTSQMMMMMMTTTSQSEQIWLVVNYHHALIFYSEGNVVRE